MLREASDEVDRADAAARGSVNDGSISGNIRKYYEKTERLQLLETLFKAGKHSELAMAAHDLLAEDNLSDSELVECLVYGFLGYANVGIYQDSKELVSRASACLRPRSRRLRDARLMPVSLILSSSPRLRRSSTDFPVSTRTKPSPGARSTCRTPLP